jgi:hypothetical protein
MVPRWVVQILHPPQKFERPPFCNGWRYGIKKYGVEVIFNGMTSLPNFIKIYQLVQTLLGGTHRQDGDLVSLTFLIKENRLKMKWTWCLVWVLARTPMTLTFTWLCPVFPDTLFCMQLSHGWDFAAAAAAASMKMTVFWDVAPCSLVEVYRRFRGTFFLHHQSDQPDDGGSKYLWNVGKLLADYTAQYLEGQSSSTHMWL